MLNEMESSSSEDEISVKALKEATDLDFLKPALFSTQKTTKALESNKNFNNTKSLRKEVREEDDNFYSFGVTATFKTYVAKKLDSLLESTIQLANEANLKTSTIDENKNKSNGNYGVKLLSSSTEMLLDEDVIVEPKNHKKRKRIIKEVIDVSQFQEAAVDPEKILSKIETKAWTEKQKGSVFKYKKLKNGILVEQN